MINGLFKPVAVAIALLCATSGTAWAKCYPKGDDSSLADLLSAISQGSPCAPPWRALKRVAADPVAAGELKAAYARLAQEDPRSAVGAREQSLWVDAAAGHPEAMLAWYDHNALTKPQDISLLNTQCWARGVHGFDLEHAMKYCDAAVAADKHGYVLLNRGMVELQLGLNAAALADFDAALADKAFQKHLFKPRAVYGRGIARLRMGDPKGAEDIETVGDAPKLAADFADLGLKP